MGNLLDEPLYSKKIFCLPKTETDKYLQEPILNNLLLTEAGYFEKAFGHYIKRAVFEEYLLIYCLNGIGWVELNGSLKKISEGEMVFCLKDIPHLYYADNKNPWSILWAHFTGDYVSYFLEYINFESDFPLIYIGDDIKIKTLFHEIFQLLESGYNL